MIRRGTFCFIDRRYFAFSVRKQSYYSGKRSRRLQYKRYAPKLEGIRTGSFIELCMGFNKAGYSINQAPTRRRCSLNFTKIIQTGIRKGTKREILEAGNGRSEKKPLPIFTIMRYTGQGHKAEARVCRLHTRRLNDYRSSAMPQKKRRQRIWRKT